MVCGGGQGGWDVQSKGGELTALFYNVEVCFLFDKKTLRGKRACAKKKFAAEAAAPGARVPFAELFVLLSADIE